MGSLCLTCVYVCLCVVYLLMSQLRAGLLAARRNAAAGVGDDTH